MNMWASMYYRIEAHFQTLWMRCPKVIPALSYKRTTCTRSNIFSNINKPAQKKILIQQHHMEIHAEIFKWFAENYIQNIVHFF